jgi:hypothetical protein
VQLSAGSCNCHMPGPFNSTLAVELRRVGTASCVSAKAYDYHLPYHTSVTSRDDAWAGLAEDVGNALLRFAERLRTSAAATAGRRSPGATTRPGDPEAALGTSQRKVLAAVRAIGDEGMTSHEAAKKTGLKNTNTPRILKALEERGLVTGADGSPVVWRAVSTEGQDAG